MQWLMRTARQLVIDSAYLVLGFPLGLAGFIVVITLGSVGLGLIPLVVGLPILVSMVFAARLLADLERLRIPAVLGRPAPRPAYRRAPVGSGFWRRLSTPLADGQSWLDTLHSLIHWIFLTIGFSFTVTWWAGAVGGVTTVLYDWAIPHGEDNQDLNELMGLPDGTAARIGLYTLIGVFFLVTLPLVVRTCALLAAQISRVMLSGLAEIQREVGVMSARRDSAVSAEATALRRLERDLHDGPQQRLVRLAMDLGRAQQQLEQDPAAARTILSEALGQTRETLDELRALSRGIAPPILTDRGLPAALHALAARSIIPVDLSLPPGMGRLDPGLENTAYFVVAEALTNVAKHSGASRCLVQAAQSGELLWLAVWDDGAGGAHLAKGHGLAGLGDRVHAAGGTLEVSSPLGGPTELRVELPCG